MDLGDLLDEKTSGISFEDRGVALLFAERPESRGLWVIKPLRRGHGGPPGSTDVPAFHAI